MLLRHGADVDAVSDSGSTPIRSACYIVRHGVNTAHFDIIREERESPPRSSLSVVAHKSPFSRIEVFAAAVSMT